MSPSRLSRGAGERVWKKEEETMMDAIASASMSMSQAQFSVEYAMSMAKKVMDTQELAAEEMLEMLPPAQSLGQYIDTYA